MEPFKASTVFNYMQITEAEYDTKYHEAEATGKCVMCGTSRFNKNDLLCPTHRAAYNKWSEQFFKTNHKEVMQQ